MASTADRRILKLGKSDDFGTEGVGGRKPKELRNRNVPGIGKLGDFLFIHSDILMPPAIAA